MLTHLFQILLTRAMGHRGMWYPEPGRVEVAGGDAEWQGRRRDKVKFLALLSRSQQITSP